MDSKKIEELLEKYWNCETSLEEEKQLRDYFQARDVPQHLKEPAALFRYFESQKNRSLQDRAFDSEVTRNITTGKTRRLLYNTMRIAAGVAVLIIAGWFVRKEIHKTDTTMVAVDTYDDPKQAFEETKKALLMISSSFGKAEEQAKKINLFNEAQQEIKPKTQKVEGV